MIKLLDIVCFTKFVKNSPNWRLLLIIFFSFFSFLFFFFFFFFFFCGEKSALSSNFNHQVISILVTAKLPHRVYLNFFADLTKFWNSIKPSKIYHYVLFVLKPLTQTLLVFFGNHKMAKFLTYAILECTKGYMIQPIFFINTKAFCTLSSSSP